MAHPRVALFTDTFDEVSGVGKTFGRLARWCAQRGLPLDVFTVSATDTTTETHGSVRIHRVRPRVPVSYYPGLAIDLIPLDDTVLTFARANEFDMVHVATPGHMGITGLYMAARHGLPVMGSYHTELPQYVSQRLVARLDDSFRDDPDAVAYVAEVSDQIAWDFLASFYDHCATVLVPSEATRQSVAPRLKSPLALFQRGVDTNLYSPQRRTRAGGGAVRLLYVGRLALEKNLDWLVEAARAHPEWEVVFVGDGPQRPALEAALPGATFAGFLDGEVLAAAYADADIFAFPSLTETFGNVVLEAHASGLPAVVGHLGGPREIIEPGLTGLVADSAESFLAHLETLAGDTALRTEMGSQARALAQQRGWDDVFELLWAQWEAGRYPWRRRLWVRWLRRLKDSDHPLAVGLVAFWKQFGRRRAARARAAGSRS